MNSLRLVNWNLEWRQHGTKRAGVILHRIFRHDPDIVCITEGHLGFLPDTGYVVSAQADYGYATAPASQRKVILWSKQAWLGVDDLGDVTMPSGRYIAAMTATPVGDIYCRGVCIPWADAHVRTGRKDRKRWQDHNAYLDGLRRIRSHERLRREIVVGDYNQRVPRKYQPEQSYEKLKQALKGLELGSKGIANDEGKSTIDHVAHTKELVFKEYEVISNYDEDGTRLSDHFGLYVVLDENSA